MSMRDTVPPLCLTTEPRLASSDEGESGTAPALLACPTWGVFGEGGSALSCVRREEISSWDRERGVEGGGEER